MPWRDDEGQARLNLGWRVQHSKQFGLYMGGICFAAHVGEAVLKFPAFEQTSKNILAQLDLGAWRRQGRVEFEYQPARAEPG